jgi:hypothetical protein
MATDVGVNAFQAKLRALDQEIEQLCGTDADMEGFYRLFLERTVAVLGVGGAVWDVGIGEELGQVCHINLNVAGLEAEGRQGPLLAGALQKVSQTNKPVVLPANAGSNVYDGGMGEAGVNDSAHTLLFVPIVSMEKLSGVLLLIAPTEVDPRAVAGYLGFVLGLCAKAGGFLERKRVRELEGAMSRSDRLRQFVSALHSSLDPRRTAYALANYGQELLGVYRCMAGTYDARGKFRMLSVSGLESVAVKSSFIRGIAEIAKQVCRNNKPLLVENPDAIHHLEGGEEADDLVTAGRLYMLQANSVILGVFPIRHEERVVGAFVVEKAKDIPIELGERRQIEEFLVEAGSAFANGLRYRNLPFSPLVRAVGALRDKVYRLSWGRRLVWSAVLLGLVLTPALVQRQVKVKGNAELVPVEARIAYVAQDGVVERLGSSNFSSDSFINAGGLILKLRDGGGEQDRLSSYLWGRFSKAGQEKLGSFTAGSIQEDMSAALVGELNRILEGSCIYDLERFEGIQLKEDTRQLTEQYGGQKNVVSLNRWLLEEAYAAEIKASESVTLTTGAVVKKGSVLAKLDTKGKEQEIDEVTSAIAKTQISLDKELEKPGMSADEARFESELKALGARLKKLELDLQQHYITSPIDGTVITRDSVLRLLLSKPTMRGEKILEVVPQATPWQLTVNVPEDESGELLKAHSNLQAGEILTARVLLKAYPDTVFTSEVLSIAKKAFVETTGEQKYRNVIEVRVEEPKGLRDQVDLRKGLQGKVAIECGRRSLYYTATHEFIDFVRVSLF